MNSAMDRPVHNQNIPTSPRNNKSRLIECPACVANRCADGNKIGADVVLITGHGGGKAPVAADAAAAQVDMISKASPLTPIQRQSLRCSHTAYFRPITSQEYPEPVLIRNEIRHRSLR